MIAAGTLSLLAIIPSHVFLAALPSAQLPFTCAEFPGHRFLRDPLQIIPLCCSHHRRQAHTDSAAAVIAFGKSAVCLQGATQIRRKTTVAL